MSNDPLTEEKIREHCGCDACDLCAPGDENFGADCEEYEALQDWKKLDDEVRALRVIAQGLAKRDPTWGGQCVLCGGAMHRTNLWEPSPAEHAVDCPWRLACEAKK